MDSEISNLRETLEENIMFLELSRQAEGEHVTCSSACFLNPSNRVRLGMSLLWVFEKVPLWRGTWLATCSFAPLHLFMVLLCQADLQTQGVVAKRQASLASFEN